MPTTPFAPGLFASHTFGKGHMEPPPLPSSVQHPQTGQSASMDGGSFQAVQTQGLGLPQDFDHIVRGIGEW